MMDDPASGWHFDIRYGQGRREIWEDARLLKPNCVMSGSITVSAVLLGDVLKYTPGEPAAMVISARMRPERGEECSL